MQKDSINLSVPDQDEIVKAIQDNNESILKKVYKLNYPKVEKFVLNNSGSKDQAKDLFQEAFISMWRNIKDEKFKPHNESAVDGYLYQIAKNKWMDYLRSAYHKKTVPIDYSTDSFASETEKNSEEDNEKTGMAANAFRNLKDGCKGLLSQFYYEKKSLKEIAENLNLDPASVRNKKYRCMQELRALALQKWPNKTNQ